MLRITNLQFLYRQQGVFDMVFSSRSKIKLTINDQYDYLDMQEKTTNAKIVWNTGSLPPIELPPFNKEHTLSFQLHKDNQYVGKARSFVPYGRNKKDCLDIVNKNFQIVGKLLYEAKWTPIVYQQKMITLQQYYLDGKGTSKPNPYTTVTLQRQKYQQNRQRHLSANKSRGRQRQIFQYNQRLKYTQNVGCFGCFSSKRAMSALDEVELKRLRNYPILYEESEIKTVKVQNLAPQTIQRPMYYSKKPYRAKLSNQ